MQPRATIPVDVHGLRAELTVLDVLARVAAGLRRRGYQLELQHPSHELLQLIELVGLSRTLGTDEITPDSSSRPRPRRTA